MTRSPGPIVIVVGGPAGTGKTTTARLLSEHFQCPFLEGDDLHPKANVEKMSKGEPLTDDDRWGWLATLSRKASNVAHTDKTSICVASCSMLKKKYREYLQKCGGNSHFRFAFLHTSIETLSARVAARRGHFMKLTLVQLQYDIMEIPDGHELCINGGQAIAVDTSDKTPEQVERYILQQLTPQEFL